MRSRTSLTRFGALLLIVVILGLAALFLGSSHGLQVVGFVVVLVAAIVGVGVQRGGSPFAMGGGLFGLTAPGSNAPVPPEKRADPAPEYIERAGVPSEEAWEHERELYRRKNAPDRP